MRFLAVILFALSAFTAFADEKKYGSFILNTEIPDTLFFVDEIKANDSFELRKALRNHDIQNIVLASPGGSVWEGLQMAGIIFDNKLRTYIPHSGNCASACAFLFFAGDERLANGKLGVHQAYSSNYKEKKAVGQTQYITQFTVSEIIGFLNQFGTPAFVYERMFQDIEMYYFTKAELTQLSTTNFNLEEAIKTRINRETIKLNNIVQPAQQADNLKENEPKLSETDLVKRIQAKLQEIGCNPGPADGIWGRKTEAAAIRFAKKASLPTEKDNLISTEFVKKLAAAPKGFCPRVNDNKSVYTIAGNYEGSVVCGSETTDQLSLILRPDKRRKNSSQIEYYKIEYSSAQVGRFSGTAQLHKPTAALTWSLSDATRSADGNADVKLENGRFSINGFAGSGCTYQLQATQKPTQKAPKVVPKNINSNYVRFKDWYENYGNSNGAGYGRIYAFRISGNCNWGTVDEIWYAYKRGKWFHFENPKDTDFDMRDYPANQSYEQSLFNKGVSKIYGKSWNRFEASGEGCTKIDGKLID